MVSYSQGWRFNFKTVMFEKTGGIYLKIDPSGASIKLDNKIIKNQSSLFKSGTLVSDLIEGKYHLNISKDGYYPWDKNADVEPGAATVFDKIVLLPKENSKKIDDSVDDFAVLGAKTIEERNNFITFGDHLILRGNKIVDVSPGGKIITAGANGIYYLSNLSTTDGASLNINKLFTDIKQSQLNSSGTVSVTAIDFHSFDDSRLIIGTTGGLYILDTKSLALEQIAPDALSFAVSGDQLVWASKEGIFDYNLVLRATVKISDIGLSGIDQIQKISISPSGSLVALLQQNGTLTLINYSSRESVIVANKVKEFSFSPDSHYLAYADYDGPLSVYNINQPEYIELSPIKGTPISQFNWYKDNAHLITLREGNLNFIELDTSLPINSPVIAEEVNKFSYDENSDLIYYSTPKGLFSFSVTL